MEGGRTLSLSSLIYIMDWIILTLQSNPDKFILGKHTLHFLPVTIV